MKNLQLSYLIQDIENRNTFTFACSNLCCSMCRKYGRWKRSKAAGWTIKEKLIWALQCFSVFSAALSSLERPSGGCSVWGWAAGSTGHCVGRGSASANLDCPRFIPIPAHSYVIICDKHLCSGAANPYQCPGLVSSSDKATCTDRAHTDSHIDAHKQNFGLQCQMGFVFLKPK